MHPLRLPTYDETCSIVHSIFIRIRKIERRGTEYDKIIILTLDGATCI